MIFMLYGNIKYNMNISTNPGVYYINSGSLRKEAVETIVNGFIATVSKVLKKKNFKPDYSINVVMVKGTPVYSYAYLASKEAINMLQGLNLDGTKRIELKPDVKCKYYKYKSKPNELKKEMERDLSSLYRAYFDNMWDEKFDPKNMKPSKDFSWADYQEEEDEIKANYMPKYEKISLPPLMKGSYSHEKYPDVQLLPARPRDEIGKVLGCSGAGKNITCSDIRDVYAKYDTKGSYRFNINTETRDYYPIVTKVSDDAFKIEFDPSSGDASYAIHMQKKTIIKGQELLFYPLTSI